FLLSMELNDYLPKQECQFLHHVQDDLETYQKRSNHTVLLFPPLPARLRYLIHSHIEDQPELTSFSVGEGRSRRLVVCNSQLRSFTLITKRLPVLCDKHLTSRGKQGEASSSKSSIKARSRGPKRPDKPLYMPRAARERLSLQNSQEPSGERASTGPAACRCSCISGSSDSCSCPKTTENTKSSTTATQECLPSETDRISNSVTDSPELCQGALAQVLDQSVALFADMTLEEDEKDKEFPSSVPSRELTEEVRIENTQNS
uniref:R3H domain-containing protein n=1 Tax=Mola mola TaxID=94237 RepID=A0A3Q3VU76_MOLML